MQENKEQNMIRYKEAIQQCVNDLQLQLELELEYMSKSQGSTSMSPPIANNRPLVSEVPSQYISYGYGPYEDSSWFQPRPLPDPPQLKPEQQPDFGKSEDQLDPISSSSSSSSSVPDLPTKTCHYFNKGFCKHGSSCKYLHGKFSTMYGVIDHGVEDHLLSPGSLEKLELEIVGILRSRRGSPVSIASLPICYYEKYGKSLRAEGYLTESQRHGRIGYSLTKLLARFKAIRLIDRPHGQHSVVLAEDAFRYNLDYRSERNGLGLGPIVSGSRQIYLTFPADSTFTEEDVSNYFSTFGTVEDVRIPFQVKRMFGFVTFASVNTASMVLAKGNPHFVCDSRVLVKPYREKPKMNERKYLDKTDHGMYYPAHYLELEHDYPSLPRCEAPRILKERLMEKREQILKRALEMERRCFEIQMAFKDAYNQQQYIEQSMHASQVLSQYRTMEQFDYLLGATNSNSNSKSTSNHSISDPIDHNSHENNLSDPFASPIESDNFCKDLLVSLDL